MGDHVVPPYDLFDGHMFLIQNSKFQQETPFGSRDILT